MSNAHDPSSLLEEIAILFADSPSPKAILDYRPSQTLVDRANALLELSRTNQLDEETKRELDQFEQAELLMRLVKARICKNQSKDPLSYCFDLGLPQPSESMFDGDPEMKRECLWRGVGMDTKNLCADRWGGKLRCRGASGKWQDIEMHLPRQSSMLSEYADPMAAPELIIMRETLRRWRFYDTFRVDARSPARQTCVATFTPIMAGVGADLPAAIQTIREIGDHQGLEKAVDDAFPGSEVRVVATDAGTQLMFDLRVAFLRSNRR